MNKPVQQATPSTLFVIFFSAGLAAIAFIVSNLFPFMLDLPHKNDLFEIFVGLLSILFGVGFTTYVLRKLNIELSFAKIFISGWATVMVMSLLISIFYVVSFSFQWLPLPTGATISQIIPVVLLKYNALGMIFSSLFALIFKKE
ncbi:MAG: hypothetical protein LC105_05815 [Chitinophagales bacterium]|nr:hypothetical protein [Chitinophagales bacterium]MCZ2393351.1 hypothetical protein [Chitinophagales bacterium]